MKKIYLGMSALSLLPSLHAMHSKPAKFMIEGIPTLQQNIYCHPDGTPFDSYLDLMAIDVYNDGTSVPLWIKFSHIVGKTKESIKLCVEPNDHLRFQATPGHYMPFFVKQNALIASCAGVKQGFITKSLGIPREYKYAGLFTVVSNLDEFRMSVSATGYDDFNFNSMFGASKMCESLRGAEQILNDSWKYAISQKSYKGVECPFITLTYTALSQ